MKLNGWHRVGIVASAAWLLAAGLIGSARIEHHADIAASGAVRACVDAAPQISDVEFAKCGQDYRGTYQAYAPAPLTYATGFAFLLLPFFWLAAYLTIWITKWVRRGFRSDAGEDAK